MNKTEIKTNYLIGEEFDIAPKELEGIYFIGDRDTQKEMDFCNSWLKKHKQKPRETRYILAKTDIYNHTIISAKLINTDYNERAFK